MKVSDKAKQYIIVAIATLVAVIVYLVCFGKGINELIAIDMDKPMDGFMRKLIDNNGNIAGGIFKACEYNIQNIIMLFLGTVCTDMWTGINIYYILSFFMISLSVFWFLDKLEISFPVAVAIAVLNCLIPFHVNRGQGQILTSNFFLAPLFMGMLYDIIYKKNIDNINKFYIVLMCLAPFADLKISVMMVILFAILAVHRWDLNVVKNSLIYWSPLTVLSIVQAVITKAFDNGNFADNIALAKDEGLRILDFIMPMRYHSVGFFSNLRLEYDVEFSASGESGLNTMGILISIGFVAGMFLLFYGRKCDKRIWWLSWISIISIVIGNIHGLNLVFEYIGIHITYWNRIGIFVILASAAVLGIITDNIKEILEKKAGKIVTYGLLVVVVMLAFGELILRQGMI